MFQKVVNRQFTLGFPGTIVRDGTLRAKVGRVASDTVDANGNTNRVGRVFGYKDEFSIPPSTILQGVGVTNSVPEVVVGGDVFFGILFHPHHYASAGSDQGALSPTLDLPKGTEGEFLDSTAGVVVEIFAKAAAAETIAYGQKLAYVGSATTSTQNPQKLPLGAIVAYTGNTPAGFIAIPNAFVSAATELPAGVAGTPLSTSAIVQLAN